MKVILTKGLPASGKSTWARLQQEQNPNIILVNKDELRMMLHSGKHSKGRENLVLAVRDSIILNALSESKDVIVHDTNLHSSHFERISELVKGKATVEVKDFTDVPLEECIKRDSKRANYVGERVIRKMYNEFLALKIEKPPYIDGAPDVIVSDIDGTLALNGDRNPYDRDFINDEPHQPIVDLLKDLSKKTHIIYVSGRKDTYYNETVDWLEKHVRMDPELYMRRIPEEEGISDVIVKQRIYNEYIKGKVNVRFVLDDRDRIVALWRQLGLTCLQVAEGNF